MVGLKVVRGVSVRFGDSMSVFMAHLVSVMSWLFSMSVSFA